MGFGSGLDIFDPVAKTILESSIEPEIKVKLLKSLIDSLEDHDWDTQEDSRYYKHPLIQQALAELHPQWFSENGV